MIDFDQAAFRCIYGAWLAWLIVWILMASRVKPTLVRQGVAGRIAHILPLIVAGCLIFFCPTGRGWWTCHELVQRGPWMAPLGAAVVLAGLGLAVWARAVLAGNWSGIVTLKQDHELVRHGPYSVTRHPIYTGLLTAMLGTALAIDQWRGLLAFAMVAVSFIGKLRMEEMFMHEAFGDAYRQYRRDVARLIPWIW